VLGNLIRFFYFKLKKRELNLDEKISSWELISLIISNSAALFRGFLNGYTGVCFYGKITLLGKNKIKIGIGSSIGPMCKFNGIGHDGISLGRSCSIGAFSFIQVTGSLSSIGKGICLGDNVGIGDFAHIGGAGGVEIGSDTIIGAYFSVHPENHNYQDLNILIRNQGVNRKGVLIGNNCWIGAKVTILDGTIIGNGCIVAAGAVVKGVYPDNVIIGGVPSRILKGRVIDEM
jgi:acetyltransferase-like isoleucine patch superfamily enzyme